MGDKQYNIIDIDFNDKFLFLLFLTLTIVSSGCGSKADMTGRSKSSFTSQEESSRSENESSTGEGGDNKAASPTLPPNGEGTPSPEPAATASPIPNSDTTTSPDIKINLSFVTLSQVGVASLDLCIEKIKIVLEEDDLDPKLFQKEESFPKRLVSPYLSGSTVLSTATFYDKSPNKIQITITVKDKCMSGFGASGSINGSTYSFRGNSKSEMVYYVDLADNLKPNGTYNVDIPLPNLTKVRSDRDLESSLEDTSGLSPNVN